MKIYSLLTSLAGISITHISGSISKEKNKGTGPVKKKKIDCLCVVSGDGLVGVTWDPLGRRRFGKGAADDGRNKVVHVLGLSFCCLAILFSFLVAVSLHIAS